jgi:RND family efflux transporter MFP subunit
MKVNRGMIIIILLTLFISVFPLGCNNKKIAQEKPEQAKVPVKLGVVGNGTIEKEISFTGTVRSKYKVDVYSKISGRVASIPVEEGDQVNKGDLLVQLDDKELRAQLNQARAALKVAKAQINQAQSGYSLTSSTTGIQVGVVNKALDQARESVVQAQSTYNNSKLDFDRMTGLYSKGAISKQALDQSTTQYEIARSRLEAAKAQVKQAEENLRFAKASTRQADVSKSQVNTAYAGEEQAVANLEYLEAMYANTRITAPISGTITFRNVDPGELVAPGDKVPAVTITDNRIVYMESDIPESDMDGIDKGKEVQVTFDSLKKTFKGEVQTIIPSADPKSRSFRIKVAIPNNDGIIKDGMFATGKMKTAVYRGIVLPRDWLKVIEGEYYIVKLDPNLKASNMKVKLGYFNERKALVLEGLAAGEKIVSVGQESLKDGDIAEIKNEDNSKIQDKRKE